MFVLKLGISLVFLFISVTHHIELLHVDTFFYRAEMERMIRELHITQVRKRNNSFSSSAEFVII